MSGDSETQGSQSSSEINRVSSRNAYKKRVSLSKNINFTGLNFLFPFHYSVCHQRHHHHQKNHRPAEFPVFHLQMSIKKE